MKRTISMLAVALAFVAAVGTGVFALGSGARTFSIAPNGPNLTGTYSGTFSGKRYHLEDEGAKPDKVKGTFTLTLTIDESSDRGDATLDLVPADGSGNVSITSSSDAAFGNGNMVASTQSGGAFSFYINKKLNKVKGDALVRADNTEYTSWVIKLKGSTETERFTATLSDGATFNAGSGGSEKTFTGGTTGIGITAPPAPDGMVFGSWTSNPGGVVFGSDTSASTTFTMPANDVTITPNFIIP